jgi:RimJ/RimL family protein N-acetyltransferase
MIETERLRLCGHRLEDFADCAAMWGDAEVTRYIGGKPFSREEVWARLMRYVGHWSLMGFGFWAVHEKTSGDFVGDLGFAEFQREIEPPIVGVPEVGWALVPRVHGKGYATEAVRAAICWGDRHLEPSRSVCLIHPENLASLRVAGKCGFRELVRTTYKGNPTILLERWKS